MNIELGGHGLLISVTVNQLSFLQNIHFQMFVLKICPEPRLVEKLPYI